MHLDVIDMRTFYASPRGALVRRVIGARIARLWPDLRGQAVLGYGFATPVLDHLPGPPERVLAFMPAPQGAIRWPAQGDPAAALVLEDALPLADASIDRAILMHGLEAAESPRHLLREIWRVLAPGGRLIAIVANRRGLWARADATPFGSGRPFSRGQIVSLLQDALFSPEVITYALHMPPSAWRPVLASANGWEATGQRLWPGFGGVVVIEAGKQLTLGLAEPRGRLKRVVKPALIGAAPGSAAPPGIVAGRVSACARAGTPPARRSGSRPTRAR